MATDESLLRRRFATLSLENENFRDELGSLKADSRSKEDTIRELEQKIQRLEADIRLKEEDFRAREKKLLLDDQAAQIGKEVRIRYLEEYRRRMGLKGIQISHIKAGNRAAHRGRPLVDALLYQSGERNDANVYVDLYGVDPEFVLRFKDVEEVVAVCGYHGTLKSDGQMQPKFEDAFRTFLDDVKNADNLDDLKVEFRGSSLLSRKHQALQSCFDEIIAADSPRYRGLVSTRSTGTR